MRRNGNRRGRKEGMKEGESCPRRYGNYGGGKESKDGVDFFASLLWWIGRWKVDVERWKFRQMKQWVEWCGVLGGGKSGRVCCANCGLMD